MSEKAVGTLTTTLWVIGDGDVREKLCPITSYPDIFGDPDVIEVTDLDEEQQTFIPGVCSVDSIQFEANYTFGIWNEMLKYEGSDREYVLSFGNRGKEGEFLITGEMEVGIPGKGVNEARTFNINIAPSKKVEITFNPYEPITKTVIASNFEYKRDFDPKYNLTAEFIIEKSSAKVVGDNGKEYKGIVVNQQDINAVNNATKDGSFNIRMTYKDDENDLSTQITVSIKYIPIPTLTASDFSYSLSFKHTNPLTNTNTLILSKASVTDYRGTVYEGAYVDSASLAEINSMIESGEKTVTIKYKDLIGNDLSKDVVVSVEITDIPVVSANDFTYSDTGTTRVPLTRESAIELSGATCKSGETTYNIDVNEDQLNNINNSTKSGTFYITFSYSYGNTVIASKTVSVDLKIIVKLKFTSGLIIKDKGDSKWSYCLDVDPKNFYESLEEKKYTYGSKLDIYDGKNRIYSGGAYIAKGMGRIEFFKSSDFKEKAYLQSIEVESDEVKDGVPFAYFDKEVNATSFEIQYIL